MVGFHRFPIVGWISPFTVCPHLRVSVRFSLPAGVEVCAFEVALFLAAAFQKGRGFFREGGFRLVQAALRFCPAAGGDVAFSPKQIPPGTFPILAGVQQGGCPGGILCRLRPQQQLGEIGRAHV